nr:hypothetical protein [Tanacetum cinerariifolium]
MACSVPHTYDQIKSMVDTQIEEDRGRQMAIMNLAREFNNACTTKDDLQKAYEECKDIPPEQRALIDNFLKIESDKDYEMHNDLFRKAAKLEKQIIDKIMLPRVPLSFQASAWSFSTLHFWKVPKNRFEVLKILENSLEVLKVLENKLESMKLHENYSSDGLVPLSIKKLHIQNNFLEVVKE